MQRPVPATGSFFGYVANYSISSSVILRQGFAWVLDETIRSSFPLELWLCYHLISNVLEVNDPFKVEELSSPAVVSMWSMSLYQKSVFRRWWDFENAGD